MKLFYLANIRIPTEKAHGIQIAKMSQAFAGHGVDLELVLPRRLNPIKQDLFKYYEIEKSFKIRRLPCLDLIALNIPKLGFWLESISFALFSFFYLIFKKADIIYSRDLPMLFLLALFKNNLVLELHNLPGHFFLYRLVLRRAKLIIVLTRELKKALLKRGVEKQKILVAPDAVSLEFFDIKETQEECRKKLNLPLNKKIVLYQGGLYRRKGVYILAESTRYLSENILTVFVGGPSKEFRRLKTQTLKSKNILVLDYQLYSQMPYFLKAADVFVLPNSKRSEHSRFWTSPMKLFEYMACQRPIIASDLPAIREILDKETALFFEPDNPKDLAKKINMVLGNKELAEKISQRTWQNVQQYTWPKRAEKILALLRK